MIHQLRIYEIFENTKDAFHAAFAIMPLASVAPAARLLRCARNDHSVEVTVGL